MNKVQRAVVAAVACVVVVGVGATLVGQREEGAGNGLAPLAPVIQLNRNPAKERALEFYRAYILGQDPSAAWEMMTPEFQYESDRMGKDHFLAGFKNRKSHPEPQGGIQIQEYPTDSNFYTFLVQDGDEPKVFVVERNGDDYKVSEFRYWKGERLP